MVDVAAVIKNPFFIVKALQCLLAIVCTALIQDAGIGYGNDIHKTVLVIIAYSGYILIAVMEMSRMLLGERTEKNLALFWAIVGAVLWITAGAFVIELYRYYDGLVTIHLAALDKLIASGIIGLLNALLFIAEAAITFKLE